MGMPAALSNTPWINLHSPTDVTLNRNDTGQASTRRMAGERGSLPFGLLEV